jgi:hypothetical protein
MYDEEELAMLSKPKRKPPMNRSMKDLDQDIYDME